MVPLLRAALALLFLAATALAQTAGPREELVVTTDAGEHVLQVEIADDPTETTRGLMFRRAMGADEGMLFDFRDEARRSFWMRNTYIPLDMLFIRADGSIDSIAERTTPLY